LHELVIETVADAAGQWK